MIYLMRLLKKILSDVLLFCSAFLIAAKTKVLFCMPAVQLPRIREPERCPGGGRHRAPDGAGVLLRRRAPAHCGRIALDAERNTSLLGE